MLDSLSSARPQAAQIAQLWQAYLKENPKTRIRDCAKALGFAEAQLLATQAGAVRLHPDWRALVESLPQLGEIMALTRNEACVHEKIGRYSQIELTAHGGVVLDPAIDLRLFFNQWHFGFALTEADGRRSLQIFNREGTAVHKVFLRESAKEQQFDELVARFRSDDQSPDLPLVAPSPPPAAVPDESFDLPLLEKEWRALKDTHDFFPLLRKHKIGREQAFRLMPDDLALQVEAGAFSHALELASERQLPIMVFVGSPGVIQIHTGPVMKVQRLGPWQNVLDEGFNLHLREDAIEACWLVRKPSVDGTVTSLEIFDAAGSQIAWMFGKRKPGQVEDPAWIDLAQAAVKAAG